VTAKDALNAPVFDGGIVDKITLSISEVVASTGIGRTRIYEEIASGRLVAKKCGRRTLVPAAELEAWVTRLEPEAPRSTVPAHVGTLKQRRLAGRSDGQSGTGEAIRQRADARSTEDG
jgi:excisionase family DNA binding protein